MYSIKGKRKYDIVIKFLAIFVLITIVFLQVKYYHENIANAKEQYGEYQIIVYDVNNDLVNEILNDSMFDETQKFIQTYTRNDNGTVNSIYTNSTYCDLSMNKIIIGAFPQKENEVMVDEFFACKLGKRFEDSLKKSVVINDKTYTITGVITKEDAILSEDTYTFVFDIKESPKYDISSVILSSNFPSIYLLEKYISVKYDTKNIMINSSFLEAAGINSFGFPNSPEGTIGLVILISALLSVVFILTIFKTNKNFSHMINTLCIALVSISICLSSYGIKNIKYLYKDCSNFDYKLSVIDNEYGYKDDIKSYLDNEIKKYGLSLCDIQFEYVNISLNKDCLSEEYVEHLINLSTGNALQFSPYSTKIITPVVLIYAEQETMKRIIQNYDGTPLQGNECIAIQNIHSKHQADFKFLVQDNETVTLNSIDNVGMLSNESLIIKKVYNNITILSDDINLPVLFVSKDIYKNYINSSNNRIIYVNQTLETSECLKNDFLSLCGFSFIDLREANDCYIKIEKYLTFQMLGLVVMLVLICVSNINLKTKNFINNSKKQKIKSIYITLAIFVGYFFCCVLLSYLIYSLLIETSVYYKYTIPILEILLSFIPLVMFVNIKPQSTTN